MKVVECRTCGRHLIDGQWVYQIHSVAEDVACCPACLRIEDEVAEIERKATQQRTRVRIATGTTETRLPHNPFDGFED